MPGLPVDNGFPAPYAAHYRTTPKTRRSTIRRIIERDGIAFIWPESEESEAA
jgi:hypothetical protein